MTPLVERILQSRKNLCQLLVVAILLALSVNLLANWFCKFFSDETWIIILSGIFLLVIAVLYLVRLLLKESAIEYEFEATLIFDPKNKSHIEIDQYGWSEKFDKVLNALLVENEAFKSVWEEEYVYWQLKNNIDKDSQSNSDEKNEFSKNVNKDGISYLAIVQVENEPIEERRLHKSLLIEVAEFCLLDFLALHLSEYFEHTEHDEKQVTTIERQHIPDILLENRVLSLLTTPIEDRQIFLKSGVKKFPSKGEIQALYASNGAVYELFRLTLPKGTKISRPQPGVLHLEHRNFKLTMECLFYGFNLNLPRYFEELYLGREFNSTDPREFNIVINAQLRNSAFILLNGWTYYKWIDSFIEYLQQHIEFKVFLEQIDWLAASTIIRANRMMNQVK